MSREEVVDPAMVEQNEDWVSYLKFIEKIRNPLIKSFVEGFVKTKVPDYFARIPASASGKYHPEFSQGYGGLLRHTMAVVTLVHDISELEYLQLKSTEKDLLFAAALLHDTFKQGVEEAGTTLRTHPNIAAQEIAKFGKEIGQEKMGNIIARLVISHMGQWGNQKPGNREQFLVHVADFIASRKYLDIEYDKLVKPDVEKQ